MSRSKSKDERIAELEEQVEELSDRVNAIEDIFSPSIIDRQTAHINAKQRDAREHLSEGDVETLEIFDPPGQGSDPDSGVGKIDGIVTFVNCDGLDVEANDIVRCRITNVLPNAAHGVAVEKGATA